MYHPFCRRIISFLCVAVTRWPECPCYLRLNTFRIKNIVLLYAAYSFRGLKDSILWFVNLVLVLLDYDVLRLAFQKGVTAMDEFQ